MFDLARDFTGTAAEASDDEDEQEQEQIAGSKKRRRRHGKENPSGAGGLIPDEVLNTGMSRKIRKVMQEDEERAVEEDMDLVSAMEEDKDQDGAESPNHWHTFKYRPILGVVVIGEGEEGFGPEVAVVERPIWEADLPPRFYGQQEWREKNSVD